MSTSGRRWPPIIERPLPDAVIYDLSRADRVVITLPAGSTWSSGLHWHERHVEYLRIVKGKVRVRLGDTVQVLSASESGGADEVKVDKNTRHEWCRESANGEDVVVVERTEPQDGDKAIFFWNLNGAILDAQDSKRTNAIRGSSMERLRLLLGAFRLHLELFAIFRSLDNFPVFIELVGSRAGRRLETVRPGLSLTVEWLATHALLEAAAVLAFAWGLGSVQRKYISADHAFNVWQCRESGSLKRE